MAIIACEVIPIHTVFLHIIQSLFQQTRLSIPVILFPSIRLQNDSLCARSFAGETFVEVAAATSLAGTARANSGLPLPTAMPTLAV